MITLTDFGRHHKSAVVFLRFWEPYLSPSALPWDFRDELSWGNPDTEHKCHYFLKEMYNVQFQLYANYHLTFLHTTLSTGMRQWHVLLWFSCEPLCLCLKWLPSIISYFFKSCSNITFFVIANLTISDLPLSLVSSTIFCAQIEFYTLFFVILYYNNLFTLLFLLDCEILKAGTMLIHLCIYNP